MSFKENLGVSCTICREPNDSDESACRGGAGSSRKSTIKEKRVIMRECNYNVTTLKKKGGLQEVI